MQPQTARGQQSAHGRGDTLDRLLALTVTPANEQEHAHFKELAEAVQEATEQSVELAYVDQVLAMLMSAVMVFDRSNYDYCRASITSHKSPWRGNLHPKHDGDVACRQGGDEFVVLFNSVKDDIPIGLVARRLPSAISQSIVTSAGTLRIKASLGFSLFPPMEIGVSFEGLG
jgi:hypothetical protein